VGGGGGMGAQPLKHTQTSHKLVVY